jgi:hypothetical protein
MTGFQRKTFRIQKFVHTGPLVENAKMKSKQQILLINSRQLIRAN